MKKFRLLFAFVFALSISQVAYANMAAPATADVGSSITFEQNDAISVLSEVLDITVDGATAEIVATYQMKNTADESVFTQAMFLSPNIEAGGTAVVVNGKAAPFESERYALHYNTKIAADDWRFAVLTDHDAAGGYGEQSVDAITFEMRFLPHEEYSVVVSYLYRLGGYPDYDFDAKEGRIQYYLAPAALWNGFGGITIHLNLDEDMPVIASSNLDFKKIGARQYQYVSHTLPEGNLEIVIDENWWQNIWSTLRSPYLPMALLLFSPFIFIVLIAAAVIVWHFGKKKRHKRDAA